MNIVSGVLREPGLLYRSPGVKPHDYSPDWDYKVDEHPNARLAKSVKAVSEAIYKELKSRHVIGKWLKGFEVWAVKYDPDRDEEVATYINGTSSFPVILMELKWFVKYEDQIGQTLWHELKHAEQDFQGRDSDEDEAENDNWIG